MRNKPQRVESPGSWPMRVPRKTPTFIIYYWLKQQDRAKPLSSRLQLHRRAVTARQATGDKLLIRVTNINQRNNASRQRSEKSCLYQNDHRMNEMTCPPSHTHAHHEAYTLVSVSLERERENKKEKAKKLPETRSLQTRTSVDRNRITRAVAYLHELCRKLRCPTTVLPQQEQKHPGSYPAGIHCKKKRGGNSPMDVNIESAPLPSTAAEWNDGRKQRV